MKRLVLLAPWIVTLAACSREPDGIQPGRWELEIVMTSVEAAGLPPAAQQQLQAALNRPQTSRECITPERALNLLRDLRDQVARGQQNMTCQTSEDIFSRGVIRFGASCRANAGVGQSQFTLDGRFNAITLQAGFSLDGEGPSPMGVGNQTVRMRGTLRGRRIGDCARR